MAGAVEEGAKVAGGFIDALKREPLSLALVLMNMCLLLFFYMLLTAVARQRESEIGLLYADKKEVRELLARCVVPDNNGRRGDLSKDGFKPAAAESVPVPLPPLRPLTEKEP